MQPGLLPVVMSLSADAPVEYRNGFKNPSGGLPAAASSSLSSEITLAKIGDEHDVPATSPNWPPSTISTFWPCAAMSGNARPPVTNLPRLVVPRAFKYAVTAASWKEGRVKMAEKPPEEKDAEVSVVPVVAPTEVRLYIIALVLKERMGRL